MSEYAEEWRTATLLNCIGEEGQRIYWTLPECSTTVVAASTPTATGDLATMAATALYVRTVEQHKHLTPAVNRTEEQHRFRSGTQLVDKGVEEHIAALQGLATS